LTIASVISDVCTECNRVYASKTEKVGVMQKLTGLLGMTFPLTAEVSTESMSPSETGAVILALYELVHLNKKFFHLLLTDRSFSQVKEDEKDRINSNSTVKVEKKDNPPHSQLVQQFFTFCSYIFSDINDVRSISYAKLCLIILTCLTEDDSTNSVMHDPNYKYQLAIFYKSMKTVSNLNENLTFCLLEILIQFIKTNQKKKMNVDLMGKCLGIIQRILSFEKQSRVNLEFKWLKLWDVLFRLLQFMSTDDMCKKPEIVTLSTHIIKIFNTFITFGEILLKSSEYDELYYEIMRNQKIILQFYPIVDQIDTVGLQRQEWSNIVAIVNHFGKEIDMWYHQNPSSTMSTDQVCKVIKSNYDSLRLKYKENLDQYETYMENPKEVTFFRQLLRILVFDFKTTVQVHPVQIIT